MFSNIQIIKDITNRRKVSAYLVGGYLRDHVLGRDCLDFDFAIERGALGVAQSFAKRIKGAYVLLDEERGCARVVKKKNGAIQTYDFADFRAKTFKGDIAHRDFSINTLAVNLKDLKSLAKVGEKIKDEKNGVKDLKAKKIRMTSVKCFKEDPLRLLRAFSLKATLGFSVEKKTLDQIKKDKELIRDVAPERVREEMFKILASDSTAENFKAMDRIGLLELIIPQVHVMFNCKQGTYHHLDVWPHSMETVHQMERIFAEHKDNGDIVGYIQEEVAGHHTRSDLMKLAALLHDIGKPETRKREKGHISFHGHERVGKNIVRSISKMLKFSTAERHILEDMVMWHLRPGYLSNFKKPTDRAVFRYFRDTKEEGASILLLSLADQRATRGPATTESDQKHHEKICLGLVDKFFKKRKEKPFVRLINGKDLIKSLKLKPSPLFAKILTEVEEKQTLGKIKTKKEALDLAKKTAKK